MLHKKGVRNTKEPHKTQDLSLQKARQMVPKKMPEKNAQHVSMTACFFKRDSVRENISVK